VIWVAESRVPQADSKSAVSEKITEFRGRSKILGASLSPSFISYRPHDDHRSSVRDSRVGLIRNRWMREQADALELCWWRTAFIGIDNGSCGGSRKSQIDVVRVPVRLADHQEVNFLRKWDSMLVLIVFGRIPDGRICNAVDVPCKTQDNRSGMHLRRLSRWENFISATFPGSPSPCLSRPSVLYRDDWPRKNEVARFRFTG